MQRILFFGRPNGQNVPDSFRLLGKEGVSTPVMSLAIWSLSFIRSLTEDCWRLDSSFGRVCDAFSSSKGPSCELLLSHTPRPLVEDTVSTVRRRNGRSRPPLLSSRLVPSSSTFAISSRGGCGEWEAKPCGELPKKLRLEERVGDLFSITMKS